MANKSIKGTQTEKNLVIAYLAESSAYTRYTFYAQQADKENYYPIGEIFRQTAANELHHAKIYFKFLEGGSVEVPVSAVCTAKTEIKNFPNLRGFYTCFFQTSCYNVDTNL